MRTIAEELFMPMPIEEIQEHAGFQLSLLRLFCAPDFGSVRVSPPDPELLEPAAIRLNQR